MTKFVIFVLPDLKSGAERIVTTIANPPVKRFFDPKILLLKQGGYLDLLKKRCWNYWYKNWKNKTSLKANSERNLQTKARYCFPDLVQVNAYLSLFIKLFPNTKFIARETNGFQSTRYRKKSDFFYKFYNNYHQIIAQSDLDMMKDLAG